MSETICTPLFFEVKELVDAWLLWVEVRAKMGLEVAEGGRMDGDCRYTGSVDDRPKADGLGVDIEGSIYVDLVAGFRLAVVARGVVSTGVGSTSGVQVRSESCRSEEEAGSAVASKFSSRSGWSRGGYVEDLFVGACTGAGAGGTLGRASS